MTLPAIPYIDLRKATLHDLLEDRHANAHAVIMAARGLYGMRTHLLCCAALPLADWLSRRWLRKAGNPYRFEIEHFHRQLGASGVYALNLCYEWGCTSGVFSLPQGPVMLRVLDWPFREMGEHMVVAHQSGRHGDYYNVTWPGLSGIYNALAPGRFAVAINQAPMRRHGGSMARDWLTNRRIFASRRDLPPSHALRKVFDEARDYAEARRMLATLPLSMPAIFILAGVGKEEGCVIERLEHDAEIRPFGEDGRVSAANHFESWFSKSRTLWQARGDDSGGRAACLKALPAVQVGDGGLSWFAPPVANSFSRVVLSMDVCAGTMTLQGVEGERPVTQTFRTAASPAV